MTVHIVDDDEAIRDSLAWLFRSRGVPVLVWESGESFLENWSPELKGCILLDMRMKGMSGLEVFDQLQAQNARQPVIFLTGHGDIPLAVRCLQQGAVDFLEKPFNDNNLVDRVLKAIEVSESRAEQENRRDALLARRASLSARESEVLDLLVDGYLNKQIADQLTITLRTVEVHRARVLEKMGAKNAVELTRWLTALEQS